MNNTTPHYFRSALLVFQLLIALCFGPATLRGGTWTQLAHTAPSGSGGVMLLLTDGTVMVKSGSGGTDGYGNLWNKLTPDANGSYVNGTWTTLAPMRDTRLYFSSQVLKDGRVFVAGGEYGTGGSAGETYNPVTNVWTAAPTQGSRISDANSELLPDGRVLVALVTGTLRSTIIFDPVANTWTAGPTANGIHNESAWVKLPDGSSLMVDRLSTNSERYIPSLNQWVVDATVPVSLYDSFGDETGPGFLLPDGRAFFIGSPSNTAYYTPSGTNSPGTWSAGPAIPGGQGAPDAAGAMMPNGKILCALSPTPTSANHFPSPTTFNEFDYTTNTFTQITTPTGGTSVGIPSYVTNMLVLPDGSVLYCQQGATQYYVYSPGGTPLAAGKPVISSITPNGDGSFHLTGTNLTGISQGAAYGDDWQMATNYPIVRLTSGANVYYARSFNWSTVGVLTGNTPVTTEFTLPAGLPTGTYSLAVIANGISSDTVSFSNSSPTVTVTPSGTSTGSSPITFTMVFSAPVTGLTASGITVTNGTKGALSGSGTTYTIPVTPSAQGAVTCRVNAGAAQDSGGNLNTVSNVASVTYDTVAPTVVVAPSGTSTGVSPITFTLTFSEAVSALTSAGIAVTNGTKGTLSGSGSTYTIPVTPSGQGAVTCQVIANAAHDGVGNQNAASNTASVTYDTVAPTVTVTPSGTTTASSPITFTLTFSEMVTGLTAAGIIVTNGTKGTLAGSGTTYTIPVIPTGQGPVTCQVSSAAAQDGTGNKNTVSNTASVTYDTVAPIVTVTPSGTSTGASPITFTLTFSESVTGLTASGITVTNGTKGALAGSGTTYTIPVTPSGQGAVTCQVNAGAAVDAAANANTASNTASVTYDAVAPTVTVTPSGTSTGASPITFTLTFSESVTGLTASGITVTNGTKGALAGSGTTYTIPVTPSVQGAVTCRVNAGAAVDAAANANTVSNTASVTYDTVAPTVTVTPSGTSTGASPITFTLTFSESVTGLTASGITVTNGTKGALAGSGATYTIPVTPSGQGAVTCQVSAGAAIDAASNGSIASNVASITYDSIAPSVTVSPSGTSTNTSPITFTLTFSEPVTGLTFAEIAVTNGTKGTLAGSGTTYTIPVTPLAVGAVTCQVIAGAAQDGAGNNNTVSNTASVTYNSVPLTPGNILITRINAHQLVEYTPAGTPVQTFNIPSPGDATGSLRDVVVGADGSVYLYNGTFTPAVTTLDPATGATSDRTYPGFSTVNDLNYGGIATLGSFVFATDMQTFGSTEQQLKGIIRFDLTAGTATRFADTDGFKQLTIGGDGLLYALQGEYSPNDRIEVFDPLTLAHVRTITLNDTLRSADLSSLAVNFDGSIYACSWNGNIYALDNTGAIFNTFNTGFTYLSDINLDSSGRLVISTNSGRVIVTTTALTSQTSFIDPSGIWVHVAWNRDIIPPSKNADLANLTVGAGTLTPAFASATTGYTDSVSNATASITVTPTVADANATVKVNEWDPLESTCRHASLSIL